MLIQNVIKVSLFTSILKTKKFLYIALTWGGEPIVFRTKKSLVNHLGKNNSRIVDGWFENSWYVFIEGFLIARVEIPKVNSKIR